ncbi:SigB/SigF/SigG family RNA polymerase sigma factor [Streptomyces sp. NPDC001941]|uniref:SigB/SigF/SigG family RNA polymerase sigma factor n=1 Tax=Streptomyces sp. NPDC001941 TaxID=3154659 RepID=UPI003330DBBA
MAAHSEELVRQESVRSPAAAPAGEAPFDTGELPWIEDAAHVATKDARSLSRLFFDRLQELEEGTHEYAYARNTLIEMNLSLVKYAASRFRHRGGGEMEDIVQVGTIGLIKAIDRFDLSREVEFTSFAVPYIVGEIKRFFRDTTWAVHVPRRLQELRTDIAKAKSDFACSHGREATVRELAEALGIDEEEVLEGLVAANGYTAGSLDMPVGTEEPGRASTRARSVADTVGALDPDMEKVEHMQALVPLVRQLGERDRAILRMRFGLDMTQAQIAEEIGVSQMQVSRLLSRIIRNLRTGMQPVE